MEIEFKSDIDVELLDDVGDDWTIAKAAWVSTGAAEGKTQTDVTKLISYLMKHKHGTPFEHSSMTFLVRAPIFVWREWHRHRIGFSYNEESGRYKQLDPVFYLPAPDRPMMKVDDWKPGRPKFLPCTLETHTKLCLNLQTSYTMAYEQYESNLKLNIDPGLARDCLPVGIYSSCWVTCNPRSLMAFLELRTSDSGASYPLYEIEMAAKQCEASFAKQWPITYAAFVANGRIAP
jgi:thymidylate synthase (FAD)